MLSVFVISGWIIIPVFLVWTAVFGFFLFGAFIDIQDEEQTRLGAVQRANDAILSNERAAYNALQALEQRVKKLEPESYDGVANKLCPECNEEKEIAEGDYLCPDCREPEQLAA